jgi:hypothetical protein
MKFEFTNSVGRRYEFVLNMAPVLTYPYVEIAIFFPSETIKIVRFIVDNKVEWKGLMVSSSARRYLDKIIKNKAFL